MATTFINIPFNEFILTQAHFEHKSDRHGINHVYRVMCHVLFLGKALRKYRETYVTFIAAFLHDLSREHDGYCTQHGEWAVERKFPKYQLWFKHLGLSKDEVEAMKLAVINHSLEEEVIKNHKYWFIVALLKDADALDRFRISDSNLDVSYLRFEQSKKQMEFARELYIQTNQFNFVDFESFWNYANQIQSKMHK